MEDGRKKMNNEMAATKRQRLRIGDDKAAGGDVAAACRNHGNKFITGQSHIRRLPHQTKLQNSS